MKNKLSIKKLIDLLYEASALLAAAEPAWTSTCRREEWAANVKALQAKIEKL